MKSRALAEASVGHMLETSGMYCRSPERAENLLINQIGSYLSDFSHDALSKAFQLIHSGSFQFENHQSLLDVGGILKCLRITMVSFLRGLEIDVLSH